MEYTQYTSVHSAVRAITLLHDLFKTINRRRTYTHSKTPKVTITRKTNLKTKNIQFWSFVLFLSKTSYKDMYIFLFLLDISLNLNKGLNCCTRNTLVEGVHVVRSVCTYICTRYFCLCLNMLDQMMALDIKLLPRFLQFEQYILCLKSVLKCLFDPILQ